MVMKLKSYMFNWSIFIFLLEKDQISQKLSSTAQSVPWFWQLQFLEPPADGAIDQHSAILWRLGVVVPPTIPWIGEFFRNVERGTGERDRGGKNIECRGVGGIFLLKGLIVCPKRWSKHPLSTTSVATHLAHA